MSYQFGREEICLVTGLRFGIEYSDEYNNDEAPISFRLHDDDVVSLCCVGILLLVLLGVEDRRRVHGMLTLDVGHPYMPLRRGVDKKTYSIFGFTWAFKGLLLIERLTPDDNEARSEWVVEEMMKKDVERQETYDQGGPSAFRIEPNNSFFEGVHLYGQNMGTPNWKTPMTSHPGTSNYQIQMPSRLATSYWQPPMHSGNPNLQTPISSHYDGAGFLNPNILNREKREQRPNIYKRTPYMDLPPTTVLPKKRDDRTKNKVKNANLSPLNLENAFANNNVGDDDIMFLGGQFTGNYLAYDNVDPSKRTSEKPTLYDIDEPTHHWNIGWFNAFVPSMK
nr:hypothetical protein [Tanacetum cinerariifolium]